MSQMLMRSRQLFQRLRPPSELQNRRGSTAVEMALLAPVFFLILVGMIEISLIIGAQQLLENATYNASRLAKTGYTANGQTQSQTVLQLVTNELTSFGNLIDASKIKTSVTAYNSFSSIGTSGAGTSGYGAQQQILVYTVTYPWPLFTPMLGHIMGTWDDDTQSWVLNLNSQIVVRNEPYG